tara:strand:- start:38489 stop:39040 length:552 start_codon:yes stop_codon:yes gene_type:complete
MAKATTSTTTPTNTSNPQLGYFKLHNGAPTPKFSTGESCCFDVAFNASGTLDVKGFNNVNNPITRSMVNTNGALVIVSGDRLAVPTGLVLKIPVGYSVRIHPRSGLTYNYGLSLANAEGVIDSDYFHELFVLLSNTSNNNLTVRHGDRIAQAEMVPVLKYDLQEVKERPEQTTDRVGGLGSTG